MVTINKAQCDTGTQNPEFNLISILYHSLEGAALYEQYISDAEQASDSDLVQFFRDAQAENRHRAERAKALLKGRM
ncbi:MAG: hypothetical protein ACFE0J_16570 [Elainellaceae cyanobacterium]